MPLKSEDRFHALDACRGAAMLFGIFLHSGASFFATPVGWAIRDRSTSLVADLLVGTIHVFRMPVFFLLAGFFARLLYERLGPRTFVYHRVRRILIPFVVALPLLSPTMNALWRWGGARTSPEARLGSVAPMFDIGLDMGRTIVTPPGHLWFLYYLSMLLAILVVTVIVLERLPLEQLASSVDRLVGMAVRGRYLAFIVAVPTAPTLLSMKQPGAADTPYGFVPQPWVLAYYGIFVAVGWFLHRRSDLLPELGLRLRRQLAVGILVLTPFAAWAAHEALGGGPIDPPYVRLAWLYLGAVFGWIAVLLFLGVFVRYLSAPRAWVRWLSDASYWCYLVHLPVAVTLQILVADFAWPAIIKFALVTGATFAFCLFTYHAFVRYTFVGTVLNGRRTRSAAAVLSEPEVASHTG
jgi:glucan biosynthesis protein C